MKDKLFLYQHKEVQEGTKSHSIKMADLEKLRHHAIDDAREPCYMIDDMNSGKSWYMMEEFMFNELLEIYWLYKEVGKR